MASSALPFGRSSSFTNRTLTSPSEDVNSTLTVWGLDTAGRRMELPSPPSSSQFLDSFNLAGPQPVWDRRPRATRATAADATRTGMGGTPNEWEEESLDVLEQGVEGLAGDGDGPGRDERGHPGGVALEDDRQPDVGRVALHRLERGHLREPRDRLAGRAQLVGHGVEGRGGL